MFVFLLLVCGALHAQQQYDLVLKGGTVVDPRNNINRILDVAINDGKIAAVAADIPASSARRVADVRGLFVTPGLVDIHAHVYAGTGQAGVYTGDNSVYPDGFTFRSGVTTVVDAGTSGWRNFPDFKQRIIDRAKTRVLALLNIVGSGMGASSEHDPSDMNADATIKMAQAHKDVIVGFKTAHYAGPAWFSVDGAVKAGTATNMPVMVDFGSATGERNINTLFMDKLRPGDIYTHCYSGLRAEVVDGKINPAMVAGRKRGIIFDVGHGGGSFFWPIATAAYADKFEPDSISTDLHIGSMNAGMKDMANVMSKILNLGTPFESVIRMSTWNPAKEIKRTDLGHLSAGAEADVAVLRVEQGNFGFIDSGGGRFDGKQRITAEVTIRKGVVVWDLNGLAALDWKKTTYRRRPNP